MEEWGAHNPHCVGFQRAGSGESHESHDADMPLIALNDAAELDVDEGETMRYALSMVLSDWKKRFNT